MVPNDPSMEDMRAVVCACEDGHRPPLSERWNKDQVGRGRRGMHGGVLVEGVIERAMCVFLNEHI